MMKDNVQKINEVINLEDNSNLKDNYIDNDEKTFEERTNPDKKPKT